MWSCHVYGYLPRQFTPGLCLCTLVLNRVNCIIPWLLIFIFLTVLYRLVYLVIYFIPIYIYVYIYIYIYIHSIITVMSTPVTTPFIQYDCENPRRDAPPFWIYQEKLRSGTVIFAPLNDRAFVKSCKCQLIGIFIFSRVIKHCSGRGTSIDPLHSCHLLQ